ncbi:hypothetical protein NQ487_19730 [Hungatella hathewayi]|uniref:Uncharacterized protein n=1 Tax=Hungatella hathewayi DSM 13479 TaxID=566550 RepID=D3ADD2_9FIRM|nr:hypothetical protein [Hungatella hathewayi]EFD00182.1 hypothetical protein CLOSTHATH_01610 [Hungatella hathewayi DSM 13479]UWO83100.1 hypothetical protein NQ487_19730 [Hungatella hathewayi]
MKGKRISVLKQIRYFLKRQIRIDARLLDFVQEHPEIITDEKLEPPPGEFQKIMEEMDRRGIKPAVERQLRLKRWFDRIFRKI